MTPKKLLIRMLSSIIKKTSIFLLSAMLFFSACAQKKMAGFEGNIKITETSLQKVVNGFYNYLSDKRNGEFNFSEYFVRINLSSNNDSTNYVEMSLYSYAIASQESTPNNFFGYLKKGNVYFVFSRQSTLIEKDSKIINPKLFKSITTSDKKYPKPTYDPYSWNIVLKNGTILDMSPKETIQKYIITQPLN